jgi:hypothetical protein
MTYGEIIAVIQCYIHHSTGKEVQINLPRTVGEIKKMKAMYQVAIQMLKFY